MKRVVLAAVLFGLAIALPGADKDKNKNASSPRSQERLVKEVRHELVMLPYYSVFDDLAYKVDGSHVTLFGAVTRPTLKSDAERAVAHIEGVDGVTNNIEVLPPSPMDDDIRRRVYRAIYSQPGLDMYSLRAVPTIHIIVKNGNVTLTGAVSNQGDKDRANIAANGVSGVFSVKNELQVAP
jgi:hyperosmotically inducible protein